jgi:acetoin utilization deacetylase AcuC-like enzyme
MPSNYSQIIEGDLKLMAGKLTGYVYDPLFLKHDWPGHPEHKGRLESVYSHLRQEGLLDQMRHVSARPATTDELALVHTERYLNQVISWQDWLDGDTYMNAYSYQAAIHAAGGLIDLTLQVQNGNLKNGIALLRPPGHHALPDRGMGFCILNNEGIAARILLEQKLVERIAIVDFDVHHGNGTQAVFYSDPRVLYISSHSYPFYPGTGEVAETGDGNAEGTTINIPLSQGSGDEIFKRVYETKVCPALLVFQPQLIIINAGYDAHKDDPLGNLVLSDQGFVDIITPLLATAADLCQGKIVFSLNGGYNLQALNTAVANTVKLLLTN